MCNSQTTVSLPLDSSSPQLILCLKQALFLLPLMFRVSLALWSLFPKTVTATQPCDRFSHAWLRKNKSSHQHWKRSRSHWNRKQFYFFGCNNLRLPHHGSLCACTLTSLKCTQRPTRLKSLCVQSDQSNSCEVAFGTCYLFLSTTSTACESTVFWFAARHKQLGKSTWGGALSVKDIHSHWLTQRKEKQLPESDRLKQSEAWMKLCLIMC